MIKRCLKKLLQRIKHHRDSSVEHPTASNGTIPPTLFKYQSTKLRPLFNLLRGGVYFAHHREFNDPYDCAHTLLMQPLDLNDLDELRGEFAACARSVAEREDYLCMSDVQLSAKCSEQFDRAMETFELERVSQIGIACFSEDPNNLLMWAHYAGGGSGFCLELDSSESIIQEPRPVLYSYHRPLFDFMHFSRGIDDEQMIRLLLLKSSDWSYEKEWRTFADHCGERFFRYSPASLLSVRFGTEATDKAIRVVSKIARRVNPHVRLLKAYLRRDCFKVEFVPWEDGLEPRNEVSIESPTT